MTTPILPSSSKKGKKKKEIGHYSKDIGCIALAHTKKLKGKTKKYRTNIPA
jgi:hypothetical protein